MPSDANGVHTLPNGYLATDGDTIQPSQHNPPLEDLSAGLTERLMRSGVAPMTGPLKLADGNSGAPGLAFNSDPSAGFYLLNGKIYFTKPVAGILPIGLGPLPWSRATIPAGWVLCYGQTLSRVTYADLWAVAQAEIAAGNPFYNNGDGSTTFGIGNMIGRVPAMVDGGSGFLDGASIGQTRGAKSVTLSTFHLPPYTPSGSVGISDPGHAHNFPSYGSTTAGPGGGGALLQAPTTGITNPSGTGITASFSGNAQGGSSTPFNIIQATMAFNFILYAGA